MLEARTKEELTARFNDLLLLSFEKDQVWRWELIGSIEDAVIARMFLGDETVINIQRDRGIVSVEKKSGCDFGDGTQIWPDGPKNK